MLDFLVTDHLEQCFPKDPEGVLTNMRAALVNAETLADIGERVQLLDVILLSRGEALDVRRRNSRSRRYIIANAIEAILGALYRDQGLSACRFVVDAHLLSFLTTIVAAAKDAKSDLQEKTQARFGITPTYRVLSEDGPDYDRKFVTGVFLRELQIGQGDGASKGEAEKGAARVALATEHVWEGRLSERAGEPPRSHERHSLSFRKVR